MPRNSARTGHISFEYIRHDTISRVGFFDVATGHIESPYLNTTRTEEDFVNAVKTLVDTDSMASWTFVCDGLNIHRFESLVRFVAEAYGLDTELGEKGKSGTLKNVESRSDFLHNPTHRIYKNGCRNEETSHYRGCGADVSGNH